MTSLGGDLEVDGTVTARQASQPGQAVVLGNDGKVPGTMLKLGPGLGIMDDGTIYVLSAFGTIDISQATCRLTSQDKYYWYTVTNMEIPAATTDGTPDMLTACGEHVLKGDTVYPHSERASTLTLPVGRDDEVVISSVGQMFSVYLTVITEDNIALCDGVRVPVSSS